MDGPTNPFSIVEKETIIDMLEATGSRDPDVLYERKATLMSRARFPRVAGLFLMVFGVLASVTVVGTVIGIPMLLGGWWIRHRGSRNVRTIEAGFAEYFGSPFV